jgi:Aminotransferase class-V
VSSTFPTSSMPARRRARFRWMSLSSTAIIFPSPRASFFADHAASARCTSRIARWRAETIRCSSTCAAPVGWPKIESKLSTPRDDALVLGQGAAVRYALEVGIDSAQARAWQLAAYARACLGSIEGVRVLDRGREQCAIVTASIPGWHAADAVKELAQRGINTSASLREYGIIDFGDRGVESAVRISPHYYNTAEEIELLAAAVGELVSLKSRRAQ